MLVLRTLLKWGKLLTLIGVGSILVCFPTVGAAASTSANWAGVLIQVIDGDTVRVRPAGGGMSVSVRVVGIDAPEICQPGGAASRTALARRALSQPVMVQGRAYDTYGRLVARVMIGNDDLGEWMVEQGHAWSYRYRGNRGPYASQQDRAMAAGLGLFSHTHAAERIYPGVFRKQHGRCRY